MTSRKKRAAKKKVSKKPLPFSPEPALKLDEVYDEGLTIKKDDSGGDSDDDSGDDALDVSARDDLFGSY